MRSNLLPSNEPQTFDSGLNSVSPNSHSELHSSSSSQTQSKLIDDSGVNMSPPPVNLKTHPSLNSMAMMEMAVLGVSYSVQYHKIPPLYKSQALYNLTMICSSPITVAVKLLVLMSSRNQAAQTSI